MKAINTYVAIVTTIAAGLLATVDWARVGEIPQGHWVGLVCLGILGVVSESMSVRMDKKSSGGTFTITYIPLFASVLLFGPATTVALFLVVGTLTEFFIHEKPAIKATFNSAQYVVSSYVAGIAFTELGGIGIVEAESLRLPEAETATLVVAFVGFGFLLFALNHALVAGAIAISKSLSWRKVWSDLVGPSGSNLIYDMLISPIAFTVMLLYDELGVWGLLTIILPLLFIRHFYLINAQLQSSNHDLLNWLVKAIEIRDPYTSGHSLRVANLSREVAEAMALPVREIQRVEKSALLHDIGKIDAVYTEILGKPEGLSKEERAVIESHVIKGEAILKAMSSVPPAVIADVRHHHERVDGKGYPDRLSGKEIPLGARIIKVCDAVDAMLSDRPYRKALDLGTVRAELLKYAGTQFDPEIVEVVAAGDLLDRHAEWAIQEKEAESADSVETSVIQSPVAPDLPKSAIQSLPTS